MWNVGVCRISGGQRHHTSDGWLLARAGWNANIYPILRILVASTSTLYISTYISTWAQAAHSSHNTALCLGSGVSGDFYTLFMANWNELRPLWAQAGLWLKCSVTGNGGHLFSCSIISSIKLSHICGQISTKSAMGRNAVGPSSYIFSEIQWKIACFMFHGP